MASAEIIAIGSELLLGETQDTNTCYLLRGFRELGINVRRTTIIGDNIERISQAIKDSLTRADIVITTGGLGPTIDDPTRAAVAAAFGCESVFQEELWQEISDYFDRMGRKPTDNNKRQAFIPAKAKAISNKVGTAPAFYIEENGKLLVSLPGVPKEMKFLWENEVVLLLHQIVKLEGTILVRTLHSFGIGESAADELIGDLEESQNPTLGLCAKSGQIDLRITAKAANLQEAEKLIATFENPLREKLGNFIFGVDDEDLILVTSRLLRLKRCTPVIIEINTNSHLSDLLEPKLVKERVFLAKLPQHVSFADYAAQCQNERPNEDLLIIAISNESDTVSTTNVFVSINGKKHFFERGYNPLTFEEKIVLLMALNQLRLELLAK